MATKKPKLRYGVIYSRANEWGSEVTRWGSTKHLERAYGHAASHVAKSDVNDQEYPQAAIYDKHERKFLRSYKRTAKGISIKDYE